MPLISVTDFCRLLRNKHSINNDIKKSKSLFCFVDIDIKKYPFIKKILSKLYCIRLLPTISRGHIEISEQ